MRIPGTLNCTRFSHTAASKKNNVLDCSALFVLICHVLTDMVRANEAVYAAVERVGIHIQDFRRLVNSVAH